MLESKVERALVKCVEAVGGMCEKHVSPGRIGVPDRLVTWPDGTMQLVETKRPDGDLRVPQRRDHIRRAKKMVVVRMVYTIEQARNYVEAEASHWIEFN